MTRILRVLLATVPVALAAGMIHAADAVVEPAPVAPAAELAPAPVYWDGFYAGVLLGYHHESVDTVAGNGSGASLGGYAGYNHLFSNNITVGVEGDYNAAFGSFSGFNWELSSFGTVRGRLGYAMDRLHVYATGGLALMDFEASFAGPGNPGLETGWTIGTGLEYMVTENISARGEYLYMNFNDTFQDVGAPAGITTDIHNVRAGVAYHF